VRIPSSFQLGGLTFTVKVLPTKKWPDPEAVGLFRPDKNEILLLHDKDRSKLLHSFFHELEHAILHVMNRDKLYRDEAFVDLHSCLLLQALTGK
jgi:Zn-dependent peptidase ImmA (M78 family)